MFYDPADETADKLEYEVQRIIDQSVIEGKIHYLTKWVGYDYTQCTWEPIQHLQNALIKVNQWKKTQKRKNVKDKQDIKQKFQQGKLIIKKYEKINRNKKNIEKLIKFQEKLKNKPKVWEKYIQIQKYAKNIKRQKKNQTQQNHKQLNNQIIITSENEEQQSEKFNQSIQESHNLYQKNLFQQKINLIYLNKSSPSLSQNNYKDCKNLFNKNRNYQKINSQKTKKINQQSNLNNNLNNPNENQVQKQIEQNERIDSSKQQSQQHDSSTQSQTQQSQNIQFLSKNDIEKINSCFEYQNNRYFQIILTNQKIVCVLCQQIRALRPQLMIDFYEQHMIQY